MGLFHCGPCQSPLKRRKRRAPAAVTEGFLSIHPHSIITFGWITHIIRSGSFQGAVSRDSWRQRRPGGIGQSIFVFHVIGLARYRLDVKAEIVSALPRVQNGHRESLIGLDGIGVVWIVDEHSLAAVRIEGIEFAIRSALALVIKQAERIKPIGWGQ